MSTLLAHRDIEYEDDTVFIRGNAYLNCKFTRCSMIVRDGAFHFNRCTFESCVWHLDLVIHDAAEFAAMKPFLDLLIASLPKPADADVSGESQSGSTAGPETDTARADERE